jgi:hypothetical protein
VPGAELQQGLEQFPGVHPDAAHMLVVMPQHDSDAHDFAPVQGSAGEATPHLCPVTQAGTTGEPRLHEFLRLAAERRAVSLPAAPEQYERGRCS